MMKKLSKEEMEMLDELLDELMEKVDPVFHIKTTQGYEEFENEVIYNHREWIVEKAYENHSSSFEGRIYLNIETGELFARTMTSNSYLNPRELIVIYRLPANWLANAIVRAEDILDAEEWTELQEKFGDDANYLNKKQLESIDVDLDERLKEFLVWIIIN